MQIIFSDKKFICPSFIIQCFKLSEVEDAFAELEKALKRGFFLAGFLSYEAGQAFEKTLAHNKTYQFPLLCFGAYYQPSKTAFFPASSRPKISQFKINLTKTEYLAAINQIKNHLVAGNTYQVNYSFKHKFKLIGDPFALYQISRKKQTTAYSAFIQTKDFLVLSLSPELFFKKQSAKITVKPMKGTMALGKGNANKLKNDAKSQAENVMIVDLLRNDLSRIAKVGSVKTVRLFEVERLKTLYQMTSTIEAQIPKDIKLFELFRNLFPSGSVTGAPKIRTMEIIRDLEKEERKIYCGAIGFITPKKNMIFNVAIRTLLLTPCPWPAGTYHGEMGVGSGIVYDSNPEEEFAECLLKAKFLV
ncbi:MAG: aminodeoxychorismate synthase component I [Candidatus Margulisiibacteriota bacterium]